MPTSPEAGARTSTRARALAAWGLRIGITVALGWWLTTLVEPARVAEVLARMGGSWWAALFVALMAVLLLHALRWQWVLRALGERPRYGQLFADVMVGMTYNLVLPTTVGGDIVRAWRCGRRLELGHRAWSSSIYERLAGLAATALCALFAVMIAGDLLGPALWTVLGLSVLLSLVFWRAEVPVRWAAALGAKLGGAPAAWAEGIRRDFEGPLTAWPIRALTLGNSLVGVFLVVLYGWLSAWALGIEDAELAIAVAMPVAQLSSAVPISINGLGLREGTIVLVMGAYGFSDEVGIVLALLLLVGVLASGAVGLLFVAISPNPPGKADGGSLAADASEAPPLLEGADTPR